MAKDLLFELGTEELPPKALATLSASFEKSFIAGLKGDALSFESFQSFASPRRLAIIVKGLDEQQEDKEEVKLGPAVKAAFDAEGKPSKAAEGFARSNGTTVDALDTIDTDKGPRLGFKQLVKGKPAEALIVEHVNQALAQLPIPKRMRWGASRAEFVRPVKWVVINFGGTVIDAEILGVTSGTETRGHRFHSEGTFAVDASNYEAQLLENKVVADRQKRQAQILEQITAEADKLGGQLGDDIQALLDEVTALVEWPVALTGTFEQRFLDVPAEALISSMVEHQKYFHVLDKDGNLMPNFITVSNIDSADKAQVIEGNEKVIRPRLADAAFFFETDKKQSLEARCEALKKIVFQKDLGTVFDKTQRISKLAGFIAEQIGSDKNTAERAGLLAKSDLVSEMVLEFSDLQGLMGYHYALNDGESEEVARAIDDHYYPAGNKPRMPEGHISCALALADRIDTLIGIFGIGQQPTGNKDPFALRRAALGILRIIIHAKLDLDLRELYSFAFAQYQNLKDDTVETALAYTIERFRAHYQDEGFQTEVYLAVSARDIVKPLDFDKRAKAVYAFSQIPEASALAEANKRVANILAKQEAEVSSDINHELLEANEEKALVEALGSKAEALKTAADASDYQQVLTVLATLKADIDAFFDHVMVMCDDAALKNNRLAILQSLRSQFLQVADISALAAK